MKNAAPGGLSKGGDELHQGGLAGAVGTDQAEAFPGLKFKGGVL